MGFRVLLLCFISAIASWTQPLFHIDSFLPAGLKDWVDGSEGINAVSVRDLILFSGGLFLVYQSVREMFVLMEEKEEADDHRLKIAPTLAAVLIQIGLLDIVFSLDSVITAVGMVDNIPVMIAAVVVSVLIMMMFSGPIARFVLKHPSVKVLALSFLLMIGVMLVAEGFGTHFNKNYIYFAMAFSLFVEMINLRMHRRRLSTT